MHLEEKVDGANLGIRLTPDMQMVYQNRSKAVSYGDGSHWRQLSSWEPLHSAELYALLLHDDHAPGDLIVYGEWLAHVHTVYYDALPGYFVAFDILDTRSGKFYSRERFRRVMEEHTTIPTVPCVYSGPLASREALLDLMMACESRYKQCRSGAEDGGHGEADGESAFAEGVYLRIDTEPEPRSSGKGPGERESRWLKTRAKLVRPDFIQSINDGAHWSKKEVRKNQVDFAVAARGR